MYWMVAIGLGLLAWGCKEKETIDPPPPPPTPNENKSFQKPQGEKYTVIVDQAFHDFYHEDKNNDKIFQAPSEKLFLEDGDRYLPYGGEEFEKKRKLANLPEFNGVHLAKWEGVHRALYPSGASKVQESRFTHIHEFCQKQGVDFRKAWELGKKMNPNQDIEKLDALLVAGLLLSVQQGQEESFYQAQNLKGEKENKKFIDTVIQNIEAGKLGIGNARGRDLKGLGPSGHYLSYDETKNMIHISEDLNPSHLWDTLAIVHETFHFYQDVQRLQIARLKMEEKAYLKGGEYFVFAGGLAAKRKQPEALEGLLDREYSFVFKKRTDQKYHASDKELPLAYGIRAAYYQGEAREAEMLKKLEESITFLYFLKPSLNQATEKINEVGPKLLDETIRDAVRKKGMKEDDPLIAKEVGDEVDNWMGVGEQRLPRAKKNLRDALKAYDKREIDGRELEDKIFQYLVAWEMARFWRSVKSQIEPYLQTGSIEIPSPAYGDADVEEIFKAFKFPYPLAYHEIKFDGVE